MPYNSQGKRIRSENLAGQIATTVAQGKGGPALKADMAYAVKLIRKGRHRLSPAYCLASLARLGVGGVFLYAGAMKLCDVNAFAGLVSRYELLPGSASGIVAISLPAAELIAGIALVFSRWVRASAGATAAMLVLFMAVLVQAEVRGLDVSCGCFGGEPSSGGIWKAVARDVVLLAPALWLACGRGPRQANRMA